MILSGPNNQHQYHLTMKESIHIIILAILVGTLSSTCVIAQEEGGECQKTLYDALQLRNAPPDSGYTLYRLIQVTTIMASDTTIAQFESIEAPQLNVQRTDSGEVWQDEEVMVTVNHVDRRIYLTDLRNRANLQKTHRMLQSIFSDSLPRHMRNVSCQVAASGDGVQRIRGDVLPEKQFLYKARAITVDLRGDGETICFTVEHPEGSRRKKTEYRVLEIDRRYQAVTPNRPVWHYFFESDGSLKEEYNDYTVVAGSHSKR